MAPATYYKAGEDRWNIGEDYVMGGGLPYDAG